MGFRTCSSVISLLPAEGALHGSSRCHLQGEFLVPRPVLLPGKFHGLRSLVGYCPWGRKESDTTERLRRHRQAATKGKGAGTLVILLAQ